MCFEAAKVLGVTSLREATAKDIDDKKDLLVSQNQTMFKRFKHVVSENDRTVMAAEALKAQDYETFGKLMLESHNSLRYLFMTKCFCEKKILNTFFQR